MHASQSDPTRIVLVPGFWLGAWAWDDVAERLRAAGHETIALTLPGLERGSDPGAVTFESHVDAIRAAIGDGPAVLVSHSGSAGAATAAVDRAPDAVRHVVWVDTSPVADGYAMDPDLEGDGLALDAVWEDELEGGSMRDLTDEQLATFRKRAVLEPGAIVRTSVSLHDERRLDVPQTLVATAFSGEEYRSYAEQGARFLAGLGEQRALTIVDLPTGHWPMWSKPAELASIIAERAA
ncbi:alpha/beta fold hydrolase [Agrococcus sp. SGAir0287]|uniref:alpha/beta fold hydrolase n=1 Tax=Agrococcus sp. SGAir0287 TaxID=2070347 RepID=UPI0010CD054E|nr:alpha/beta hydrolase [Agrococcus sp. SGAir0287]QCR18767.1 alpha/beta hydrolase [Agrococcus sp. SGAir0287]